MFNYCRIPPSSDLSQYIRNFWSIESKLPSIESFSMNSYVDDSCGIAFQICGPKKGIIWNHLPIPVTIIYGLTTSFHSISITSPCSLFGVVFHSQALYTIFGCDAANFVDNAANLQDVLDKYLVEQIYNATSTVARIQIIEQFVRRKLKASAPDIQIYQICQYISHNKGILRIGEIEQKFGIHIKQLERKFRNQIGVSPVHFIKIARFQEALKLLKDNGHSKLTEIAYELEFADQSHFIRQVRRFSGHTPSDLRKNYVDNVINLIPNSNLTDNLQRKLISLNSD